MPNHHYAEQLDDMFSSFSTVCECDRRQTCRRYRL